MDPHRQDLIGRFANHAVAANLLMTLMIMAGLWSLYKLNTQFFPNFALDVVSVSVVWPGAAAEDIESSIVMPMEQSLRGQPGLRRLTSTAAGGMASINLEYHEGTAMVEAVDKVKEALDQVRNLPSEAESPQVRRVVRYDPIARVLLTGPERESLRHLAHQLEDELLARGIARVAVRGLPEPEIAIQVPAARLRELDLSLTDIGRRVADMSRDLPAGAVGRDHNARTLRSLDQRRRVMEFDDIPVTDAQDGHRVTVGDIATIERRGRDNQMRLTFNGQPAVELLLQRAEQEDSLKAAAILEQWLVDTRPTLPPGVELNTLDQQWQLIEERINLLLTNGLGGLVLVVLILFLFLDGRVAFWVAVGIPVSFMATLAVLLAAGGSINMVSLFGLIMALGIIVDDAIVVGEDAYTHYQNGEDPLRAAEGGARRMLAPVVSSSLTTICAFLPLMLIGGPMGKILFAIPLVIVCVIIASLFESFLVLPGHLRHSFHRMHHRPPSALRARLNYGFEWFKGRLFRPLVTVAVRFRAVTITASLSALIMAVGLVAGGRIGFTFFPSPEGVLLFSNVAFSPGSPPEHIDRYLAHLQDALKQADQDLGGGLVRGVIAYSGAGLNSKGGMEARRGDYIGALRVQLISPDLREARNAAILDAWRSHIRKPPGLETFTLFERLTGPPGRDLEIRLTGNDADALKAAADELDVEMRRFPGVSAIEDDMPWGKGQLVFRLTPLAHGLGLSVEQVGRQVRAAYTGHLVQVFQDGYDEVEVRVMLPDAERHSLASLDSFDIVMPDGNSIPLRSLVTFEPRQGFEVLRHDEARLAVTISAAVDTHANNANRILDTLKQDFLPDLVSRHGIHYSFEGRAADQRETLADMRRGGLMALAFIYLVLAWVFSSYSRPLIVMLAIPFGLTGALAGHWLMGLDLTILSLFGMFGLSGIVVNDSIILVTFYRELLEQGMEPDQAIVEAACRRLRAVLLTSLTTIAGLTPLLFEGSLQAQFLIPMAVSISFGLGFATLLVLLVIPAALSLLESARRWLGVRRIAGIRPALATDRLKPRPPGA